MFRLSAMAASRFSRRLSAGLAVLLALSATTLAPFALARPTQPDAREAIKQKNIAIFVSSLMNRRHMAQLRMGDQISERAMDMFLK